MTARTVARLLRKAGYSLQGNAKTVEGKQHPDRDAPFGYLNTEVAAFGAAGDPVISVDTKKKELVGDYANGGAEWEPAGDPRRVNVHDFPDQDLGKAVPYGVYDVGTNTGWVNVGTNADTGQFAVESIRRWWNTIGRPAYPEARRLLITADSGGSNGSRLRLWKTELAGFATETGLKIIVLHLPPGTSKWNRIEHRLFSHISMNWRGRPLTWDQGTEMANHAKLTIATDLRVYFAHPRSPWERPSNENTNGLIREYLPKGVEITSHQPYLNAIADERGDRPRQTLGFHTPREVFEKLLLNRDVASTG